MPTFASVIIAVRNDETGILATLDALADQILDPGVFEVIVVDDGSTDGTADLIAAHPRATLLRRSASAGAYVARNQALRVAEGAVIAVTDGGCLPAPDWLERGISRLAHEGENSVLAGHIAMPLGPHPTLAAMVDVVHHLDQQRVVQEEGYAVTANLIAPRSVFDRIGGFDESLRSSGDVEWTRRAGRAGVRLVYAEEVVVTHPPRTSARELLAKSRRVAEGGSTLRRAAKAPVARAYLNRDVLIPRHRGTGKRRVRANGAQPSRARWLAVGAAQIAYVQLPQAAAALRSDVRAWIAARRSTTP